MTWIKTLTNELWQPDWSRRHRAAQLLGEIGGEEAIPPLNAALADECTPVVLQAIASLVRIGSERAAWAICYSLEDGRQAVRDRGRDGLVRMGEAAVPALCETVRKWDLDYPDSVLKTLTGLGPLAVPGLLRLLEDENTETRFRAVQVLRRIGDARAVPGLCACLNDADYQVRRLATEALGRLAGPEAVPDLVGALRDEDAGVRAAAIGALTRLGNEEISRFLVERLRDRSAIVRTAAAEALGTVGDRSSIPPLLEAFRRDDPRATVVAQALAQLADRYPVPELRLAVPLLKQRLSFWSWNDENSQAVYRAALQRIVVRVSDIHDLPMPAFGERGVSADLPLPAVRAEPTVDRLPVPAMPRASVPGAPDRASQAAGWGARLERVVQRWMGGNQV